VYVGADARAYLLPRDLVGLSPEEFRAQKHENTAFAGVLQRNIEAFHVTQSEIDALAASTSHVSHPVHPVQLYASIDGLLLAWLLNVYFYRRKRFGMVFGVLLLLYPFVRVVEEIIRIDNPHDTAGLTISQFISLVLVLLGVAWVYAIRRMPLRPPNMVPYVPPPAAKPA
jgi:prolipoprotein diacylglyceryltransferase